MKIRMRSFAALVLALSWAPAFAQVDLTGTWVARLHEDWMDRWPGPDPGDFAGLPLNPDGQAKAVSYSASQLSLPERQCIMYPQSYTEIGPFSIRLWSESDPVTGRVVALKMNGVVDRSPRTFWMDGRPHPSKHAVHTFEGFSTGQWRGNTLVVKTTHIKAGVLRRNGAVNSDESVLTEYFTRNGNLLNVTLFIEDPAYLDMPHVLSRDWVLDPTVEVQVYGGICQPAVESPGLVHGDVPHYLPGQNPFVEEFATRYNLPVEAVMGGAKTLMPEYRDVLREHYETPQACGRYCCGWVNDIEGGLQCVTEEAPLRRR